MTSKPQVQINNPNCPAWMVTNPPSEPIAPKEAIINENTKDFLAGEFLPWARGEHDFRVNTKKWCDYASK